MKTTKRFGLLGLGTAAAALAISASAASAYDAQYFGINDPLFDVGVMVLTATALDQSIYDGATSQGIIAGIKISANDAANALEDGDFLDWDVFSANWAGEDYNDIGVDETILFGANVIVYMSGEDQGNIVPEVTDNAGWSTIAYIPEVIEPEWLLGAAHTVAYMAATAYVPPIVHTGHGDFETVRASLDEMTSAAAAFYLI